MASHVIGRAADLPPGARRIVTLNGLSIGVFNVGGEFFALLNRCAHQGGPLCLGEIKGLAVSVIPGEVEWTRDGEILRCPWHHWEFDIKTGLALIDPARVRVKSYEVTIEAEVPPSGPPSVPTYPVTVESGWLVVHA
jgi:3-phenylpropionate/trans-cinnamate dioxygenase ferredoxin subunit